MTKEAKQLVEAAIRRLECALKYGPDMASSAALCVSDAQGLLRAVKEYADADAAARAGAR